MPSQPALGLSITDGTLEALQLVDQGGSFKVTNYAWIEIPEGLVSGGKVNDTFGLSEQIKKLLSSAKPRPMHGKVILGLPQSHVFLKVFNIPPFEGKDLNEAISWHINSLRPVLPKQSYTSHQVITSGKKQQTRVLLAAASESIVDGFLSVLSLSGIQVSAIEPMALSKARLLDTKELMDKNVVSTHLYGGILTISILVGGHLWFSQESVAADNGTNILSSVDSVIGFFNEKKERDIGDLSNIVYSGDPKGIELLKTHLAKHSLPPIEGNPGIILAPSKAIGDINTAHFAPVLGLAMRAHLHSKGLIDLLPTWPKEKDHMESLSSTFSLVIAISLIVVWSVVALLGGAWLWLGSAIGDLNQDITRFNTTLSQQQESDLTEWTADFNQTVSLSSQLLENQPSFTSVFNQLASATPANVSLSAFTYDVTAGTWSIAGSAATRDDVLLFDSSLKNTQAFANAQLYLSSLDTGTSVVFRFSGEENGQ